MSLAEANCSFDIRQYHKLSWYSPLHLFWMLNPAIALNELLCGQRMPRTLWIRKNDPRPVFHKSLVFCPHCKSFYNLLMWTKRQKSSCSSLLGVKCGQCSHDIPIIRNWLSLLIGCLGLSGRLTHVERPFVWWRLGARGLVYAAVWGLFWPVSILLLSVVFSKAAYLDYFLGIAGLFWLSMGFFWCQLLCETIHVGKSVLITGFSGSGKSTISWELTRLGYSAHDFESMDGFITTIDMRTGKPFAFLDDNQIEVVKNAIWNCSQEKLWQLMRRNPKGIVFYNGVASNIDHLLPWFDKVFVLMVDEDVARDRLRKRNSKTYGKSKVIQDWIVQWKSSFEHDIVERGAIPINANRPACEVVSDLIRKCQECGVC